VVRRGRDRKIHVGAVGGAAFGPREGSAALQDPRRGRSDSVRPLSASASRRAAAGARRTGKDRIRPPVGSWSNGQPTCHSSTGRPSVGFAAAQRNSRSALCGSAPQRALIACTSVRRREIQVGCARRARRAGRLHRVRQIAQRSRAPNRGCDPAGRRPPRRPAREHIGQLGAACDPDRCARAVRRRPAPRRSQRRSCPSGRRVSSGAAIRSKKRGSG